AAPYTAEDLAAGEHLAGMAQQVGQQIELSRGEFNALIAALDFTCRWVQDEVGVAEFLWRLRSSSPQKCSDARLELLQGERFGQVVIRAAGKASHLVGQLVARREHDDRYVTALFTDGFGDLEAIQRLRQHHIEDHEV